MTELETVAERIRAATSRITEKVVDEKGESAFWGMAFVRAYATETQVERARDALESAGGTLERAIRSV
nr:hypothetical protein [Klebsiella pneumoniae]